MQSRPMSDQCSTLSTDSLAIESRHLAYAIIHSDSAFALMQCLFRRPCECLVFIDVNYGNE